ncbi:MAG TPA: hypothetical protein VIX89_18470 [Bryobacteraceae bacterium]
MTLKNAAFLALIGQSLLTVMLVSNLITMLLGVARDVIPVMTLFRSLGYVLASLSLVLFFYVFHKTQS